MNSENSNDSARTDYLITIRSVVGDSKSFGLSKVIDQLGYLYDVAKITPATRILDIGCHSGVHLLPLQRISSYAYGIDKDVHEDLSTNKQVFKCDVFQDELPTTKFDLIFCFAPFFGDDWWKIEILLRKVAHSLRPGGKFVFDLRNWHLEPLGQQFSEETLEDQSKGVVKAERKSDRYLVWDNWSKCYNDGKPKVWRIFSEKENQTIWKDAGLEYLTSHADFDVKKPGVWSTEALIASGSPRLTVVGTKSS